MVSHTVNGGVIWVMKWCMLTVKSGLLLYLPDLINSLMVLTYDSFKAFKVGRYDDERAQSQNELYINIPLFKTLLIIWKSKKCLFVYLCMFRQVVPERISIPLIINLLIYIKCELKLRLLCIFFYPKRRESRPCWPKFVANWPRSSRGSTRCSFGSWLWFERS